MSLPLVSTVLPVYYVHEPWLRRSVTSVLEQDYPKKELILVNDGASKDIDSLVASFGITRYIKNPGNCKLPYSLNRGFEAAQGEYLTWTSADNYMLPGMIARLVRELQERPEISIVCGRSLTINERDERVQMDDSSGEHPLARCSVQDGEIPIRYTYFSTLGACFMFHRAVWEKVGGYDESRHGAEDYDFWIRAARHFRMGRIPWTESPLYAYRVHGNSISARENQCFGLMRVDVLRHQARQHPDDPDLDRAIAYYTDFARQIELSHGLSARVRKFARRHVRNLLRR